MNHMMYMMENPYFATFIGAVLGILYFILVSYFIRIKKREDGYNSEFLIKLMQENKERISPASRIKNNFTEIQTNLHNAQGTIQKILEDVEKQMKLFEKEKEKSQQFKQIASINEEQYNAFSKSLIHIVEQQNEKNNKLNIRWGIIFCILSAILGNILTPISRILSSIFS